MAARGEVTWDAEQFQMDRFGLNITATSTGLTEAGEKLLGVLGPRPSSLCQVDNCTADVARMKEYHSRYKICETHLRASVVTKDGRLQRFCQQCGKFQPIEEFDAEKRSCRARLDKHNARRRRQREMQHMLRTTGRVDEAAVRAKYGLTEEELAPKIERMQKQMRLSNSSSATAVPSSGTGFGGPTLSGQSGSAGNIAVMDLGIPGITQADLDLLGDSFLEEVLGPMGISALGGASLASSKREEVMPHSGSQNAAADFMAIDPASVMDLSDMTVLEELTREFGMNPNAAAYVAANGNISGAGFGAAGGPVSGPQPILAPALASSLPMSSSWRSFGRNSGSLDGCSNTSLAAAAAAAAAAVASAPRTITTGVNVLPPYTEIPPMVNPPMARSSGTHRARGPTTNESVSVLEEALNLLAYDHSHVPYATDEKLVRFSAKLFGCTPADLPPDLRASLADMLAVDSMEGYMRPGCVHLEIDAMMVAPALLSSTSPSHSPAAVGGMHEAVERFLERYGGEYEAISEGMLVFQLGETMAVVRDGHLMHVLETSGATALLPSLGAVRPLAILPTADEVELGLWGYNLGREGDVVLARSKGRHLEATIVNVTRDASREDGLQCAMVRVQGPLEPGTLQIEVMRGSYTAAARSVLITSNEAIVAEIRTLELVENNGEQDTLLYELGSLMEAGAVMERRQSSSLGALQYMADGFSVPAPPGRSARRLLPFIIQRKWPAALATALSLVSIDMESPMFGITMADELAIASTGMSLLQLAVRTQSSAMLVELLQWGRTAGYEFKSTKPGHQGLTALHLAALIPDGGLTAALLTAACPDALRGWEGARADDGSSPLGFATRCGTAAEIEHVITKAQRIPRKNGGVAQIYADTESAGKPFVELPGEGDEGETVSWSEKTAGAFSMPNGCLNSHLSDAQCPPKDRSSQMNGQGRLSQPTDAAAMGPLLTFKSREVESSFAAWYCGGRIPVDIAFHAVAIVSQLLWMVQWQLGRAPVLEAAVICVATFSAVCLTVLVRNPQTYATHRDLLCVATLIVQRILHLAMNIMPTVGIVYSSTFNPAVAVLESTSFAQIAMLSFGLPARTAYYLPALAASSVLPALANGLVCRQAFRLWNWHGCVAGFFAFQNVMCLMLPAAIVYLSEYRLRGVFLRQQLTNK